MKKIYSITLLLLFLCLFFLSCEREDDDKNPPEITILGANPYTHTLGQPYDDPGATASDEEDGDISDKINIEKDVDINTQGYDYHVYYSVEDDAGNETSAVRDVYVLSF